MSRWEEQFEKHQIHDTISELEKFISVEFEDVEQKETTEKRRIHKILDIIKKVLSSLDPEIIPFNSLDSFNTQLKHNDCYTQLSSYSGNGNIQYLITANNHLTKLLNQLSQYMILTDKFSVNDNIKSIEKSFDDFSNSITISKDNLSSEITSLTKKIQENETYIEKLNNSIEQKKQETDSLISQWQQQFSSAQEQRTNDFTKWFDNIKEKSKETLESHFEQNQENINKRSEEVESQLTSIIEDSDAKHKRILELYELTAGDSVGSAYLSNANDEKTEADTWRDRSIYFIIATAVWIFFAFIFNAGVSENGIDLVWGELIMSFSLTGVLLYGAAYSAQQSTKHRNNEKKARWFALEVKAIDPFISSLKETDQQELKKQLSEKLFAQSKNSEDTDKKVIDEHAFNIVIKGITDIFKANKG